MTVRWKAKRLLAAAFVVSVAATGAFFNPQTAIAAPAAKLGVHEKPGSPDYGRTPAQVRSFFGSKATVGRAFVSGVQSSGTNLVNKFEPLVAPYRSAGFTRLYVSVKLSHSQVTGGVWDSRINALGVYICQQQSNGIDVRAVYWHEPENDMTGNQFAPAMTRFTNELHQGCSSAKSVFSAMGYQWRPGSSTTSNPSQWAAAVADDYAVDVYNGRSFPLAQILPENPGFARWHANIPKAKGVWWSVTERGWEINGSSSEMATRAATMEREFQWLINDPDGQKAKTWIGWNSSGTEESDGLLWNTGMENRVRDQFAAYPG